VSYDAICALAGAWRASVFTLVFDMLRTIRDFENFHILLWLLKDTCWLMEWRVAGSISIVPTLAFALYITYRSRESTTELVHNSAVCFWIVANSLWMLGEFFYEDTTRPMAVWFFVAGLALVVGYYLSRIGASLRGSRQGS
jgi:hypothetical protein